MIVDLAQNRPDLAGFRAKPMIIAAPRPRATSTRTFHPSSGGLRLAPPGSRTRAIARSYAAHGFALNGDHSSYMREFGCARESLEAVDDDPSFPYGLFFDVTYVNIQEARSLTVLGRHRLAAGKLRESIELLPRAYRRDRGAYLSWGAHAYLGSRDLDEALSLGEQALTIARETGSGRIMAEIVRLREALPERSSLPQVHQLHESIAELVFSGRAVANTSPRGKWR